jgi:hypothetical protein
VLNATNKMRRLNGSRNSSSEAKLERIRANESRIESRIVARALEDDGLALDEECSGLRAFLFGVDSVFGGADGFALGFSEGTCESALARRRSRDAERASRRDLEAI